MSELHRRALVRCSDVNPAAQLGIYFRSCADASGCVRLALRSSVRLPRLDTEVALLRDVMVTVSRDPLPQDVCDAAYRVDWTPADGGAFPRLSGTLTTWPGSDTTGFMLVLNGRYGVPGRAAGGCEGVLAYRIAQATARDLLLHIRDHIESTFRVGRAAGRSSDDLRADCTSRG